MVYNSGPSLKPSDCQYAVQQVIDTICSQRNYCKNTTLATIRPEAMVMLSKLPTYNFSSSCAGYIDTIYADYMKQNRANYTKTNTGFPAATGTATKNTVNTPIPKWQAEYNERASELKSLQAQTKTTNDIVSATDFPTTFNDLSFSEKNDIKRQGYEPYKGAKPYTPLNVIPDDKAYKSATDAINETYAGIATCLKGYQDALAQADTAYQNAYVNKNHYNELQSWADSIISAVEDVLTANGHTPSDVGGYAGSQYVLYDRTQDEQNGGTITYKHKPTANMDNTYISPSDIAQAYIDAKNQKQISSGDIETNFTNAKDALKKALQNDHHSPCICTNGNRFRDAALGKIGVTCKSNTPTENAATPVPGI